MASAIAMDKPMRQAPVRRGRPALPQGRAAEQVAGAEGRPAAAPVRGEAGQRRLQRRRADHHQEQQRPAVRRHRVAVRRFRAVRGVHPGPRADRRRDGRPRHGRDGTEGRWRVLRLRPTNTPTAVTVHLCPAPLREDVDRRSDAHGAGRAPDPRLPRRRRAATSATTTPRATTSASCICWRSTPSPA